MKPRILIAKDTWHKLCRELDRVYPNEGLLVPMLSLTPRQVDHNPCAPLHLADLGQVLIAEVLLLPPELQSNQAVRVRALPTADKTVDGQVQGLIKAHPRYRACAYLHSHPFAQGSTWPSGSLSVTGFDGDIRGHMLPLLAHNRRSGLELSLSFIACRSKSHRGWKLQAFAMTGPGLVSDLGFAQVVAQNHPAVLKAQQPSLNSQHPGRCWLRRWKREAKKCHLKFRHDELFDGWRRTMVEDHNTNSQAQKTGVMLIPCDFPYQPLRFYLVDKGTGRNKIWIPEGISARSPQAPRAFFHHLSRGGKPCPPERTTSPECVRSSERDCVANWWQPVSCPSPEG